MIILNDKGLNKKQRSYKRYSDAAVSSILDSLKQIMVKFLAIGLATGGLKIFTPGEYPTANLFVKVVIVVGLVLFFYESVGLVKEIGKNIKKYKTYRGLIKEAE